MFVGAGAFREQIEIVNDINQLSPAYRVLGILDDNYELHGKDILGVKVLGPLETVGKFATAAFVMGVGSNRARLATQSIFDKLNVPLENYETLIHPSAKIYSSAKIGIGTIIHAGCIVGNGSILGDFTKVIWNAVIGADNILGDGVTICANSTTSSGVKIGGYTFIAGQCAIADNIMIGPMTKIGLGSVIARDVDAGSFMLGNPARKIDSAIVPAALIKKWEKTISKDATDMR